MLRKIFLIVLALAYIGLGLFLFIKKDKESPNYILALASLLLVYGSWRLYRAFKIDEIED